jgi:hypothetical protein
MRRLLVAAASGAVLLLGAGCSTDKSGDAAPAPGLTATARPAAPTVTGGSGAPGAAPATTDAGGKAVSPGDAALAANTDAICKQATTVSSESVAAFASESKQLAAAKKAADPVAAQRTTAQVQRRLQSWSYALRSLSELTSDAALKKSFGTLGGKVEKLSQAKDPATVKQSELRAVRDDVAKACSAR